jgi:hypothetical protein
MTCSLLVFTTSTQTSPVTTCLYNSNDGGQRTLTFTTTQSYSSVTVMSLKTGSNITNPDSVRFLSSFIVTAGTETSTSHNVITYTAAALASASASNAVQSAGSFNTMTFTFRLTNSIPQSGQIQIIWPSQVKFDLSSAEGLVSVTIYGTAYTGFTTEVSQPASSFVIKDLFSSAGITAQSSDIIIAIQQMQNPESQVTSNSFSISTQDGSNYEIDKLTTGITVESTEPGSITVTQITPISSTTVDAQVTVQIYETTDIRPTNAFLRVYWPSEITYLTSGTLTCTMSLGFTANTPPCIVDTVNNYIELSFYRSNSHLYTVGTFQNPLGAITTSTWKLVVLDVSDNVIMQKITDITYTTTTNTMVVTSATRPTATTTIALRADYSIIFVPPSRLLSDSTIQFIFPIDQVKYDGTTT